MVVFAPFPLVGTPHGVLGMNKRPPTDTETVSIAGKISDCTTPAVVLSPAAGGVTYSNGTPAGGVAQQTCTRLSARSRVVLFPAK